MTLKNKENPLSASFVTNPSYVFSAFKNECFGALSTLDVAMIANFP